MHEHRYISGSWWIICDSCSSKIRSEDARHRWDGFIVCQNCFEERHPQDFIRARVDKITVPFVRPRPEDVFVELIGCHLINSQGIAGIGVAGCAVTGKVDVLLGGPIPPSTQEVLPFPPVICTAETRQPLADFGTADCMIISI